MVSFDSHNVLDTKIEKLMSLKKKCITVKGEAQTGKITMTEVDSKTEIGHVLETDLKHYHTEYVPSLDIF